MWSTLAGQIGLAYTPIDAPAGFDRLTASVGVISAGGVEEKLEAAVRQTGGRAHRSIEIATVDVAHAGLP